MTEPVLLVHWERTLGDLLDRTARFPRPVRFTFANHMDTLGLNILDALIRARWSPADRPALLRRADADLAVLRTLLRLSHDRRWIDPTGLEHLSRAFDEAGRMLHAWQQPA